MINLNPAIEQKINQFILKVKLAHQKEATNITQETQNLRDELNQKLGELTFSDPLPCREELEKQIIAHTDQLVETINLLSTGKISETPLNTLSQETDSLVTTITILFDANANVPNLPKLKEKLTAWQTKVKDTLVKFSATVELQQKNESLIAKLEDNLDKYSSIPEVDEPFEKLVNEFKDNFAQLQEASVLFKNLDDLINEIKARDEGIKLNQRIDILLEKTKEQVAGFPPELDREVQGELAKLIKILGIAQVELMNISKPCDIMQVKAVVDAGEIAIKSLTGQPNIILAQKLRYAAKTGLRKTHPDFWTGLSDFRDNLFHSVKIPTKVLIGLVLALPLNWGIMISFPVNDLLMSLPPIINSSNQNTEGQSNQNTEEKAGNFRLLILILMTGTLGGAVSLLIRLQDFDDPKNQKYDDDLLPLIIGLTKPILGGSFAFFILLILNSNIFPIEIRPSTKDNGNGIYLYGLLTMAFVAGFSERLVPDLISQVEKKVTVEASSTGQGLPPAIFIAPSRADLALNGEKEFTINPVGNYTITISPPESGKIDKNTTDAKFTYTAPSQGNAGDKITITATSDSGQTAKATVTLTV
ncbi:MAG: apolipoprotein A1/A4/E family protein [Microcystis aeruginosa G13-11]|nr:apolipoprotein A1/A4/E family protein [Microcystis aeruginosa G13-11]